MQVGVLDDKPHRDPLELLGTYAGGPVRKASRKSSGKTNGEILVDNMERLNIDLLREPFQEKNSPELLRFSKAFLKLALSRKDIGIRRVENLLQAIVRNPILRQEYGGNDLLTKIHKGFDRHLIDTGQMFKSIIARAKRVKR